jgi:hypothetical protein
LIVTIIVTAGNAWRSDDPLSTAAGTFVACLIGGLIAVGVMAALRRRRTSSVPSTRED